MSVKGSKHLKTGMISMDENGEIRSNYLVLASYGLKLGKRKSRRYEIIKMCL